MGGSGQSPWGLLLTGNLFSFLCSGLVEASALAESSGLGENTLK